MPERVEAGPLDPGLRARRPQHAVVEVRGVVAARRARERRASPAGAAIVRAKQVRQLDRDRQLSARVADLSGPITWPSPFAARDRWRTFT